MLNVNAGLQMASSGFRHMNSSCCWAGFELSSTVEKLKLHELDLGFVFVRRRTDCSFYDWQRFALKKPQVPTKFQVQGAWAVTDFSCLTALFTWLQPCCISCITDRLIGNDPALPWTFCTQRNKNLSLLKKKVLLSIDSVREKRKKSI